MINGYNLFIFLYIAHPGRSKTAKGGMSTVTVPPRAAVKPGKPTFSIVAGNGATL